MSTFTPEQLAFARWWIDNLRSGEFKQNFGSMHSIDGSRQCCLGVAGRLLGHQNSMTSEGLDVYNIVAEALGLERLNWQGPNVIKEFIYMNDSQRKSFAEIADFAETIFFPTTVLQETNA